MGLKRNQKVRLVNCPEAEVYPNVVLSVKCDSYMRVMQGEEVELVKLKELTGEWHVGSLQPLTAAEVTALNGKGDK